MGRVTRDYDAFLADDAEALEKGDERALAHLLRALDEELAPASVFRLSLALYIHAENTFASRFIPFLVLGFWDENTGIYAGAMPYRRDFPATTGI